MRFLIRILISALLFSFVNSVYGMQADRILRKRDFQKPPRQGVISNKDLQRRPRSLNAYKNNDQNKVIRRKSFSSNDEHNLKSSLLARKAILEERIETLESELNALNTRVLQNRPTNPLTVGDPYYVDPKMREQKTL